MFFLKRLKKKFEKKYFWTKYPNIAKFLCKGNGLEVGALSCPHKFHPDCKISFADINNESGLRNVLDNFPEKIYEGKLVKLDYILKKPKYLFEQIKNNTFDFVYSSHCLEHSLNPIATLVDQIRITKSGGIIYTSIPNKKYTYDKNRKTTSISKLIDKFQKKIFYITEEEATEIIRNTKDHPLYDKYQDKNDEIKKYAKEIADSFDGIHHIHTYDQNNVIEILNYLVKNHSCSIIYFAGFNENKNLDLNFAIQKN